MPAASASTSPCAVEAWSPVKPSRSANTTAAKAHSRPTHCSPRSRSDFTHSGTSTATQKGEVYKNTVRREALVYCRPM
jgi:hypothetical protein